jgi:hypothetical protein
MAPWLFLQPLHNLVQNLRTAGTGDLPGRGEQGGLRIVPQGLRTSARHCRGRLHHSTVKDLDRRSMQTRVGLAGLPAPRAAGRDGIFIRKGHIGRVIVR